MPEELPSLLCFQPKFYVGGPSRFHLPLLYDLVAVTRPKSIAALGFGDGQVFFTFCQGVREQKVECQCLAVRRERAGEKENDDVTWLTGREYGQEFYGDLTRFQSGPGAVEELADHSVDLLLLDDCDSGAQIRADLSIWQSKLAPSGLVLFHGIALERGDDPKAAWLKWTAFRPTAEFPDGLGLGITLQSEAHPTEGPLLKQLFSVKEGLGDLVGLYRLAAARIAAQARADEAVRAQTSFEARQIWIDSLRTDRWKAQEIMDQQSEILDHQRRTIESQAERLEQFENLRRDRAKAQLVMDCQLEQLELSAARTKTLQVRMEQLKAQVKEQSRILNAAKKACRKKGRCFGVPEEQKKHRPIAERMLRELRRLPRNLGISRPPGTESLPEKGTVIPSKLSDRYAAWISKHEPDVAGLEEQRRTSPRLQTRPKISLLVPLYNTPARFLEEMFVSVSAQTYDNWELCVVDGGSDHAETLTTLQEWVSREPRIRLERLNQNLGISENTNRALKQATGDFIACVDHDDLLAPFALYELARAIGDFPDADIFYSDEDRWSEKGIRHTPFFKPEWSPELLYASMYIGHLTAYRRALVDQIGGFRKEFDLSQDYDFALRATERARVIHHIPHVLYHWREHPASGSTGGKPEARTTNLAALADAMRRRGLPAEIIEYPTANRARLLVPSWPRVSVIVPTDSPTRAQKCLHELPRGTKYPDLEIVIVTNSKLLKLLESVKAEDSAVRFVPYDKPFNFSDKCNIGAAASTGARLIFFNDDVEPQRPEWIQDLIEPLENREVGAVAPKLLYESGKIQHAGLVMGVRGLTGTAFHQREAGTTEHCNMAQSLRDVAALSAACLAMRREDFVRLGGFDAVNTPIDHSDIDLCFRIREAGMRCVYTPYATLSHAGHVSISSAEKKNERPPQDKAPIYLLKRWPLNTTHDPYFTDNMRDWLYADSPTPIRMFGRDNPNPPATSRDLLFVSHDLSLSGAPILLLQLATWCKDNGIFVVVVAPEDGPLREKYKTAGIPLIIDPLSTTGHESFEKLSRDFDCVLANTIRSEPAVRSAHSANIPVIWWMHETQVGEYYLQKEVKLRSGLALADVILVPTDRTGSVYRLFTDSRVVRIPYGIPDAAGQGNPSQDNPSRPVRFLVLGSIEPRKGQDVFVKAVASLPPETQAGAEFHLLGRVMDSEFGARVFAAATSIPSVSLDRARDHGAALEVLRESDVLVCSSRDEAMPVTILEALSMGKAIISTRVGGIAEALTDGHDALLVGPEDVDALARAMERLTRNPELIRSLGRNARETFRSNFQLDRFGADFRELVDGVIAAKVATKVAAGGI